MADTETDQAPDSTTAEERRRAYVRSVVDAAPPLTPEAWERIGTLLNSGRRADPAKTTRPGRVAPRARSTATSPNPRI